MTHTAERRLRIAIATLGRFHVLDLARELDALGHDVQFYSYVPKRRAMRFGLRARCHVALLPWLAPVLLLTRLLHRIGLPDAGDRIMHGAADRLVAIKLRPCDVFIGMSGIYLCAFRAARRRYNALLVLERGSLHIAAQRDILDRLRELNPRARGVSRRAVRRELAGYALADRIAVPSTHAEKSFLYHGIKPEKLFRNPYGVDLTMFRAHDAIAREPGLILFVGGWCLRKGADILTCAMHELAGRGFRLQHVGGISDAPVPTADWFSSTGSIDQSELPFWYQRASCLVLPSREDGFGLVLIQALACGCPVIGSDMTGARDLQLLTADGGSVKVVPTEDVQALSLTIESTATTMRARDGRSSVQHTILGWERYARRYSDMLHDELTCRAGTRAVK